MTTGASNPRAARAKASFGTILSTAVTLLIYGALIWEMWSIWTRPVPADFPRLQTLALIMGFEFLLVHSGLMAAVMPRKVSLFFILPVYGVVAYFLNLGAENNLILFLYAGVLVARLRFLFTPHTPLQKSRAIKISIVSALIYFFAVSVIAIGEASLPAKGLTQDFLQSEGYFETLRVSGIFTEHPHLPLIMGLVYFSLMALLELYLLFLRPPRRSAL